MADDFISKSDKQKDLEFLKSFRNARSTLDSYGMGPQPTLHQPLQTFQVQNLLEKVNMNNAFLKMATEDKELIDKMKNTILAQDNMMKKRERLVQAILHNITYLRGIHEYNARSLKIAMERLTATEKHNRKLKEDNDKLQQERDELKKTQKELDTKTTEMKKMAIDAQANKDTIENQYQELETLQEKMEKLNLEVTVVVTEKLSLKKEYNRIEVMYRNLGKDNKELRANYNLLHDEVSILNKQNNEYRGTIIDSEQKLASINKEIQDLQKNLSLKQNSLQRAQEENMTLNKQIEKLFDELRDKSDSESFDDEKARIMNVQKALESEQLKIKVKALKSDILNQNEEFEQNMGRISQQLKFSQDANRNLKNDYDNLQDKFDKNMKVTSNLNMDLKEEIEKMQVEIGKLLIFKEDHEDLMRQQKEKIQKQVEQELTVAQNEAKDAQEKAEKAKQELDDYKGDFNIQMQKMKLLENELEQKLEDAEKSVHASDKDEKENQLDDLDDDDEDQ